jgi:hypothetical protein
MEDQVVEEEEPQMEETSTKIAKKKQLLQKAKVVVDLGGSAQGNAFLGLGLNFHRVFQGHQKVVEKTIVEEKDAKRKRK